MTTLKYEFSVSKLPLIKILYANVLIILILLWICKSLRLSAIVLAECDDNDDNNDHNND